MLDYKKLYAYLLGQIDDALVFMLEGRYVDAYRLLQDACLSAEEVFLTDEDNRPDDND